MAFRTPILPSRRRSLAAILESVAGFSALQLKDYASAQKHLRAAVEGDPNNVENVYALATALLPPSTPADEVNGLFFIARAVNLITDPTGKEQVKKFGRSKYMRYHGGDDGWTDLLAQTASTPLPPAGFTSQARSHSSRAGSQHGGGYAAG